MEEWKEYRLGDICTKIGSGATPKGGKEAYLGGKTSLIRSQNVLDLLFLWDGLAYISDEQAFKLNNVEIDSGDILLNITGDSVARSCMVPDSALPARVNQHVAIIRGDKTKVLNTFILYFLQYKKRQLLSLSQGGATRNALTKKMIEEFEIKLPELSEQKNITSILSSLDDKIENNRKINENLEQQAQALFKSWFVDFEPFRDQPFVDSELGPIPQGWKVESLSNIAEFINGLAMQRFRPMKGERGIPVLKIKELGMGSFDTNSEFCSPSLVDNKFQVNNGDIIFSWSGTLMVKIWCGGKCGLNQHLFNVVPKGFPKWFVFFWTKYHLANFIRIAKDKAVTMGHIKRGELDKAKVLIPSKENLVKIDSFMRPIHEQILSIELESRNLAKLRDTLLPKLMSGEIKV